MKKKCYRCNEEATSVEHIPAQSFFPKENRKNLITVPSCDLHNSAKSKDDEYVRNLLASNAGINDTGLSHALGKVFRSFKNSKLLTKRVFANSKDTVYLGESTKSILIEKERFVEYLSGIAYGLYRHEFEKNYEGHWYIHVDFQYKDETIKSTLSEPELKLRNFFRSTKFPILKGDNPEVFKYSYFKDNEKVMFKIELYENTCIYLVTRNAESK
ncbi:hypothetical protein [Leptospira meyeri]|uniref:hypothetical protein n=1 Tax=Leptospira meyeri TaxID=29508 RepID=UPI00223D3089|nr:hypothetical protein [Leptospira meyeri]MCW7490871.1 hypothetical protein [Leptospira meyeri]